MPPTIPKNLLPRIIFEDQHIAVLSKPAGLLSQPAFSGQLSLVDACRELFGRNYIGIVHRLDRNASGLCVVAKRSKAAGRLSEQVRIGSVKRIYHAWVVGDMFEILRQTEGTRTNALDERMPLNPPEWCLDD
ncbi:hypothetical protein HDU93_005925, partial [Gonapodya sp. JEL0774]